MGEWNGVDLSDVTLRGPRLTLRPFLACDVPAVYAAMQHAVMHEFLPLPDPYTQADAADFVLGFAQAGRTDGTAIECAVLESASGALVGTAGLRLPGRRATSAEIGYAIYPHGQGNGYAAEATRVLTAWAFEHRVARVAIRAAVRNLASIKSALNAGFHFEGVARADVLTPVGAADGAVLGRLPDDPDEPVRPTFAPLPPGGLRDGVLTLRLARPEDTAAMLAASRDPEVVRWTFTGRPMTQAEATAEAAHAELDWLVGRRGVLVMVDAASGSVAGTLVLRLVGPPGVGGVGYSVHPDCRGRGYTARALRLLRAWALTDGGLKRLELGASTDNIASQRAARPGGFVDDGVRVGRLRNPDGSFSDEMRFAALS